MRDADQDSVLVVVADTRANRAAVVALEPELTAGFPVTPRAALAALAQGRHPGGSALILL